MLAVISRAMEFLAFLGLLYIIFILIGIIVSFCSGAKDKSSKNKDKYETF